MFDIAYRPAADPVKERRAPRDAGAPVKRAKSMNVGADAIWVGVGAAVGVAEVIAALRADNERPNLVIVADVRAAKETPVAEPLVPRTDKNDRTVPGVAALERSVEARPCPRHDDRRRRQRRLLRRKICGRSRPAYEEEDAGHGSGQEAQKRCVHGALARAWECTRSVTEVSWRRKIRQAGVAPGDLA